MNITSLQNIGHLCIILDMNETYYSIKQFASIVGLCPRTIYRSIKAGKINAFRPGVGKKASYRIPETELGRLYAMRKEYE